MIEPWWAAGIAVASIATGDLVNRHVTGWLPDDPPRPGRKTHARPIPLAGALLVPTILTWCVAAEAWLLLAALTIGATIGWLDDCRKERADSLNGGGLDWRIKAIGLFTAAGLVATTAAEPLLAPWRWAAMFALTFTLTNAVNFLDNTDGVAASLAGATLLVLGFAALPPGEIQSITLAAGFAGLAFLPFNWPRARLFLGDSGAYALGLCVSHAITQTSFDEPLWLLAVAVPLTDFMQVVLMRLIIGVPPWVGDRRHLTHIAQNLGLHRVTIAPLFAALATGIGLLPRAI